MGSRQTRHGDTETRSQGVRIGPGGTARWQSHFVFSPFRAFAFSNSRIAGRALALGSLVVLATGCARDGSFQPVSMWNQSRLKPLEESPVPGEGSSSRPLPPGTMARGERGSDDPVVSGR